MTERTPDFDAKREACEAAHAALLALIDHPDKTVPVCEYMARLSDAKRCVNRAHKAMMAAR